MAGMPYPPTSVNIRVISGRFFSARGSVSSVLICGSLFSAKRFCEFRAFCGNIFSPTEFTEFTEFGSVGMAGMPYPPTSVLICAICGSLFSARGSVYSVHSVGASSPLVRLVQQRQLHPLAESTEVVCKSHHLTISPPHHLSHLEPSLLNVLPVLWVRLRHHLRLVDAQPGEHDCRRCERHRHAVVVVGVDRL